jgi:phosphatidylserine/phosphatidylglycerophosphate/cardiolipin synthase-like enzyme
MLKDKTDRDYYRTTTSGKYKLYLYPGPAKSAGRTIALTDVLDNVTCTGAAEGYGKRGRTVIRVATYSWTSPRLDLAERLWSLHNKGCKVDVIYNSARASRVVTNTLLRKSAKYGTMPVFDAFVDRNWNDRPELYMHHKVLAISGVWFGRPNTKVTYTGSQNFTGNATVDNNDIVFRIKDNATYDAYDRNLDYIQERAPRRWW